jgi:integral membrane protein
MTPLRLLRTVSALEGLSYLFLLFVAMPLKYGFGRPEAVEVAGAAHGGLFIAFGAALVAVWITARWSILRVAMTFGLSLVPFGFLAIDRQIAADEPTPAPAPAIEGR